VGEYLAGRSKDHPRAGSPSILVSERGYDVNQAWVNPGRYLAVRQRALLAEELVALGCLQTPEAGEADHHDIEEDQELSAQPANRAVWPASAAVAVRTVRPARPARAPGGRPASRRRT